LIEVDNTFRAANETIISAETGKKILACVDMTQPFAKISDLLYASDASVDVKQMEAVNVGA
jgi:hypothetical protein